MFAIEEQRDAPRCTGAVGREGWLRWAGDLLSGRHLTYLQEAELLFPLSLNPFLSKGSSSPEESALSRKGLKAVNVACSWPPACSHSSRSVTLTGHWVVSLLFFRILQATKKSSSATYFTLLAVALAELAESSRCCCMLAARWKVFPSPSSDSLGSPDQGLLPRDEARGSPSDGGWGGHAARHFVGSGKAEGAIGRAGV